MLKRKYSIIWTVKPIAFTLIEVMIAMTLLVSTIVSIYKISDSTKILMGSTEDRVTALYLAEEWLEFMRNKRDTHLSKSWNKEYWWNFFLKEIFWDGSNFLNSMRVVKKINRSNSMFSLWSDDISDRNVSSIDDICGASLDNCIYEKIILMKGEYESNERIPKEYYRKLVIEKDQWETNIIKVNSIIYWEDKWNIQKFSLDFKLANIAIY